MTDLHNPPHPGLTLREDVLPALGLTVTAAAAQLGVTRACSTRALRSRPKWRCASSAGWVPNTAVALA